MQPVGRSCRGVPVYLCINWLYPSTICLKPSAAEWKFTLETALDQINTLLCVLIVKQLGSRREK